MARLTRIHRSSGATCGFELLLRDHNAYHRPRDATGVTHDPRRGRSGRPAWFHGLRAKCALSVRTLTLVSHARKIRRR